jgi:hypothetical protein
LEPGQVQAPVAIIAGGWDGLVTDQDALAGCSSGCPDRPSAGTSLGTHLMHLAEMRTALWRESVAFLLGDDLKRT